jgi:hypothetical protein
MKQQASTYFLMQLTEISLWLYVQHYMRFRDDGNAIHIYNTAACRVFLSPLTHHNLPKQTQFKEG